MAGKIEGATGKGFMQGGPKTGEIPTSMWEVQNVKFKPESSGSAFAGEMLKKEYDKSKGTGLGVPK